MWEDMEKVRDTREDIEKAAEVKVEEARLAQLKHLETVVLENLPDRRARGGALKGSEAWPVASVKDEPR